MQQYFTKGLCMLSEAAPFIIGVRVAFLDYFAFQESLPSVEHRRTALPISRQYFLSHAAACSHLRRRGHIEHGASQERRH